MKRADFWHAGDFGRYLIVRRASNNGHVNGRQPDADNPTWTYASRYKRRRIYPLLHLTAKFAAKIILT
jgi:hypothetical protein